MWGEGRYSAIQIVSRERSSQKIEKKDRQETVENLLYSDLVEVYFSIFLYAIMDHSLRMLPFLSSVVSDAVSL